MNFFAPVAIWGFWALLVVGWVLEELSFKAAAILILLWLAGFIGSRVGGYGTPFTAYAAVLDIALVFIAFKGDVRLG